MRLVGILTLGLVTLPLCVNAEERELVRLDGQWIHYANGRFGTRLDVPASLFRPVDSRPANGGGWIFRAQDGAQIHIFGSYSATTVTKSFAEYKTWIVNGLQKRGTTITYKAQGTDWLVASGINGSDIFYMKIIEGCDATHEMWITYPSASKRTYDPLIGRLVRSLRCTH